MTYASGAPAIFGATAGFALSQLARLNSGVASLSDLALTISGQGKTGADAAAFASAAGLPAGVALDAKGVVAPGVLAPAVSPYLLQADKSDGVVTLTGYCPDDKAHEKILAAAKANFVDAKIVDQLKIARGAPAGVVEAAIAGFAQLAHLAKGQFGLNGNDAVLTGEIADAGAAADTKAAFAGALPEGFTAAAKLTFTEKPVAPPVANAAKTPEAANASARSCQAELNGLVAREHIQFVTASARLSAESWDLLDRLADAAQKCPSSSIEVVGHTDNVGDKEDNDYLSKRRALAIVRYLRRSGVDEQRLTATGDGNSHPIASNDTEEGRAQNRRIEFIVK